MDSFPVRLLLNREAHPKIFTVRRAWPFEVMIAAMAREAFGEEQSRGLTAGDLQLHTAGGR